MATLTMMPIYRLRPSTCSRGPGGALPRIGVAAPMAVWLAIVGGCSAGSADQVTAPVPLGMTSAMAPYYSDGNLTIYQAARPVPLPVRKPTSAEVTSLGHAPSGTPYPRAPFLLASDESVELHYTIVNLDAQQHLVGLLVDPWNEFVRWEPGVTVVNDDVTTPNFGYDLSFLVEGKSRVEGTITPDDFREIATKLAAAQTVLRALGGADAGTSADPSTGPTPTDLVNHIFNPQNRSNVTDPLYSPWIPPVVAGVTGFDLGLRTFEAANVAVEISLDVQDLRGDRFVPQDSSDKELGTPSTTLTPPAARF